jgi:heme A synthase
VYTGLLHSHRILAYLFIITSLAAVILALVNRLQNKPSSKTLNILTLASLATGHLQLILGLSLYFVGPWFGLLSENPGEVMRDSGLRYFAVEHISTNLIGIALVTVGRVRFKKHTIDSRKHQAVIAFIGLGLLLIASRVPWSRLL